MHTLPSAPSQLAVAFHGLALLAIVMSGLLLLIPIGGSRKLAARIFFVGIILAVASGFIPGFEA